ASSYFSQLYETIIAGAQKYRDAADACRQAGDESTAELYDATAAALQSKGEAAGAMGKATTDVTLNCDQTGFGAAPTIGLHYKLWHLDFAVKYDFRTKMTLENVSANSESARNLSALSKFADGNKVREDNPALLTAGVSWQIVQPIRLSVGYHHFFDKQAKAYNDMQKKLDGGTNEFLAGLEVDVCKPLMLSVGVQSTNYQFTDDYMNDISFNVSSYTIGCGACVRVSDRVRVNVAYFQTNYQHYDRTTADYNNISSLVNSMTGGSTGTALVQSGALAGSDSFTRTNKTFGLGVDFSF
ncbi:hypothetical protein NP234_24780, partial [Salmonella enterica]|nr:hypothetical protein [Salmonella enterica]